jgi:translation elongation factor EF-4
VRILKKLIEFKKVCQKVGIESDSNVAVSAKTGFGIQEMFQNIAEEITMRKL